MCQNKTRTLFGLPQCLRWTMFTLNVLLFISAGLTLGYGCYLLSSAFNLFAIGNKIPIVMFISFAVLLIVSCVGSVAAYRLSRLLLLIYSFILWVCLVLQIVIIVSITTYNDTHIIDKEWWYEDLSVADQQWIEKEFNCCGFNASMPNYAGTCDDDLDFCESKLKSSASHFHLIGVIFGGLILTFEVNYSPISSVTKQINHKSNEHTHKQLGGIIASCVLVRSVTKHMNDVGRYDSDSNGNYEYMAEPKENQYWKL
eukprot:158934_1